MVYAVLGAEQLQPMGPRHGRGEVARAGARFLLVLVGSAVHMPPGLHLVLRKTLCNDRLLNTKWGVKTSGVGSVERDRAPMPGGSSWGSPYVSPFQPTKTTVQKATLTSKTSSTELRAESPQSTNTKGPSSGRRNG